MADKELRRMNRTELIEIIYALQQNDKTLRNENEDLRRRLDDRMIRLENAGSIAEAALSLNHIFEDAQNAASQYLESLAEDKKQAEEILADAEKRAEEILTDAEKRAEEILADAKEQQKRIRQECIQLMEKAEQHAREKEEAVNQQTRLLLNRYPELREYMRREMQSGGEM